MTTPTTPDVSKKPRKKSEPNKFSVAIKVTKLLGELPLEDQAWVLHQLLGEIPGEGGA